LPREWSSKLIPMLLRAGRHLIGSTRLGTEQIADLLQISAAARPTKSVPRFVVPALRNETLRRLQVHISEPLSSVVRDLAVRVDKKRAFVVFFGEVVS